MYEYVIFGNMFCLFMLDKKSTRGYGTHVSTTRKASKWVFQSCITGFICGVCSIDYYTELNVEMEPHLQVKWSRLQEKVILIKARNLGHLKNSNFNKGLPLIRTLAILYIVSYSRGDIPLLLDLRPNLFNISATTSLLGLQNPPEATSESLKLKHFLREHTSMCYTWFRFFPFPNKISCMNPDVYNLVVLYRIAPLWGLKGKCILNQPFFHLWLLLSYSVAFRVTKL